MSPTIQIAQQLSIRDAGLDEYWLQDQIYENPTCLGLGELEAIAKERTQNSGGRLDILLKNPEDDSMYEVEIMLGETDETHIIRTIEYWDNEKRRWPQRQHYAVLVAEHINRRFFNVIHLLSNSIPIIAVQASLLNANDKQTIFFSKVLDTYEELDDGTSIDNASYNREYWVKRAQWTLDAADSLLRASEGILEAPKLNYLKFYVAVDVSGSNYFWFHRRMQGKSLLVFRISTSLQDEAASILDAKNISYTKKPKRFQLIADSHMIEKNAETFGAIAELVKRTWQKD